MWVQQRQDWIRGRRQKRKLARAARLRRQILRYLVLCLMLAAAGCGFVYFPWTLTDLDRDVIVRGNQVVSVEQVRAMLSSCVGRPLYRLDPARLASRVESLSDVQHAFVRRYVLPRPHIVVDVLEEFPWASIGTDPSCPTDAVIAETGRRIPVDEFPSVIKPQFKIYARPGLEMTAWQVKQWAEWTAYISAQTGQNVDFVDMRNPQDVRIQNGDLYLKIGTPDTTLTRRLGRLASLMPAIGEFRERLEYIDLSLDNNIPLKVAHESSTAKGARADNGESAPGLISGQGLAGGM